MSVFITGASSGIGAACAWAFAAVGQDLILAARREEKLKDISDRIASKYSVSVATVVLDVKERGQMERWMKEHSQSANGVDVLINNAGLARGMEPIQNGSHEDWDEMIDTNIKGLLYISRALLPVLIENKGHIVNIGSVAGRWTYPNGSVYCATKYAVKALNEAMRLDLHGSGVRVTEIAPGLVETEFSEVRFRGDKERAKKIYSNTHPLKPEDIAEAVVWSVSRPKHVNVQEMVLFPVDQASVTMVKRT